MKLLSCVRLFATPWTVAYQAPPSMRVSRQEYWSGLPFPSPGDLPNSGIEPGSPTFKAGALIWATREANLKKKIFFFSFATALIQVSWFLQVDTSNWSHLLVRLPNPSYLSSLDHLIFFKKYCGQVHISTVMKSFPQLLVVYKIMSYRIRINSFV